MPKKISTFQKKKLIFGHFCDFAKITKMAKNPFFILKGGNFFQHTLIIWGDNFFVFSILFDSIKKNGQNRKKDTFAHGPFFQFLAQKCQKYQFSWKNLFLTIFLWVISVRKGFLYLWQTLIFEPARAILLRRVRYQTLWMRVFGQKCQKYWFSWKEYFLCFFLWVISDQLAWNKWNKKKY